VRELGRWGEKEKVREGGGLGWEAWGEGDIGVGDAGVVVPRKPGGIPLENKEGSPSGGSGREERSKELRRRGTADFLSTGLGKKAGPWRGKGPGKIV